MAIVAVIINHYAIFYFQSKTVFANGLMTFFYLLGGAGVYISLNRDFDMAGASARVYLKFIYKRCVRIYPLYWIAYAILTVWMFRLGLESDFNGISFMTAVIGAPANSTGAFWFVTSILECYLLAPLMFLTVRRTAVATCMGLALMFVAILLPASLYIMDVVTGPIALAIISYKRLFLGNLLLFFLGMLMPALMENYRRLLVKKAMLMVSAPGLIVLVWATDGKDHLFPKSELYMAPFLYMAALFFSLTLIAAAPRLPLRWAMGSVGRVSYQLYLLHIPFFMTLGTLGLIELNSYRSIVYTLALSPVLLGVCHSLNYGNERLRQGLGERLFANW